MSVASATVDWHATAERLAGENSQLKGIIGVMASRYTDTYYGDFSAADIENGLKEGVKTIHHSHGGVTVMTGMGT